VPDAEIFALALDGDGRLWVGTGAGLFRQVSRDGRFEPAPGWPSGSMARSIWVDPGRMLVVGGARLFKYDLKTGGHPQEIPGPWRERLDGILRDASGRLWVRSRSHLWIQAREGDGFQEVTSRLPAPAFYDGLLFSDGRGTILVPTADGLVRVRGDQWEVLNEDRGMPVPWVNRVLVDREGSLWLGGMGVFRSLGGEVWRQYTHKDGIPGGVVRSILRDARGSLWLGTVDGLHKAGERGGKAVAGTDGQAILALSGDKAGGIWMGGAPPVLRHWVPGQGNGASVQLPSTITSLFEDPDGSLWVGTRRSGLYQVRDTGQGPRERSVPLPGGAPDERIQAVAGGSQGRIWVGGSRGLALFEQGSWTRLTPAQGLDSLHVIAVKERNRGDLWVSFMEAPGLYNYLFDKGRLRLQRHLTTREGLSSDQIYFLQEDAKGRLWAGTSLGVNLIDGTSIQTFGTGDGLPGEDCNGNGFFAERNGDVWVGTLGGLALFQASAYKGLPQPPRAFILSARFGNRECPLPTQGVPEIPYREGTAEFKFTGLSYLNEGKVRHEVRLVGWDGDTWRPADFRQVRFTNLAPGSYCLEVRAGYGNGAWGEPATFSFVILPPWWRTWWFRGLSLLGLGGLAALAVNWRMGLLRRRNRELENLVEARTADLAKANQTLQQLTVTDPLTGLKNRRFLDLTIEDDLAQVRRDYHFHRKKGGDKPPVNLDLLFFMVDLDHFKRINDTYGHAAGDLMLRQVRDRLLQAVRESDSVIRWGGEEFLVVARAFDRAQAGALAQRILELVRAQPFDLGDGLSTGQTCSVGFAPYPLVQGQPAEALSWERVVEVADRCLYCAKESGRDAFVGVKDGRDPGRAGIFLTQPDLEVAEGNWDIASSLDPARLVWHPGH
jgi:diguanylate cyclase (GGDEF)-like protein